MQVHSLPQVISGGIRKRATSVCLQNLSLPAVSGCLLKEKTKERKEKQVLLPFIIFLKTRHLSRVHILISIILTKIILDIP